MLSPLRKSQGKPKVLMLKNETSGNDFKRSF